MKKIILITTAAIVTAMSFASVSEAGWRHRHHHNGAFLVGGLALGLMLNAGPRYEDDYEGDCTYKKRIKYNRYGERVVKVTKTCY